MAERGVRLPAAKEPGTWAGGRERTANDEILLDLVVGDPWGVEPPRGDVVLGNHWSASTLALMASLHRSARTAPFIDLARTSGASVAPSLRT
jgi:hypothetical protein